MEKDSKKYEIGYLVRQEDESSEIINVLEKIKADILENGGISKIKLAYPIEKENFACFGYIHFSANPEEVLKVNQTLKLNPKVLRFLIITPPIVKTLPQIISKKPMSSAKPSAPKAEVKKEIPTALTNEALEKKLEEILK